MQLHEDESLPSAERLIVLADGVYAGRQRDNRIGVENSRIGYRHPNKMANVCFADGHADRDQPATSSRARRVEP